MKTIEEDFCVLLPEDKEENEIVFKRIELLLLDNGYQWPGSQILDYKKTFSSLPRATKFTVRKEERGKFIRYSTFPHAEGFCISPDILIDYFENDGLYPPALQRAYDWIHMEIYPDPITLAC